MKCFTRQVHKADSTVISGTAIAASLLLLCSAAIAGETITLSPNKTTRLDIPGKVMKLLVSNPKTIDAALSDDGKAVVIKGLAAGSSELRISRDKGEDLVYDVAVKRDLSALAQDIKSLLNGVEGVTVKAVEERIVLDGNVITRSDQERVEKIAGAYADVILNLTKLDRTEMNKYVAEALQKEIGIKTIKVDVQGDTATLEGVVFDPADAAAAIEKAKQRCTKVVSLLRMEEVMIETDVYFVAVDTDKDEKTGINLLKALNIDASASVNDGKASYNVSGGFAAKINELIGEGKAKFLATPHLSTKSGETGRFHSGGEDYFEVSGTSGGNLEKVEHGVILTVKPSLKGQDRVVNEITLEVSVPKAKQKGAFALEKYSTKSTTMSKIGDSILISGLSQTLESQFKEKTPLLGDVPILSAFFKEKTKSGSNKELLVVITPKPVFPVNLEGEAYSAERQHLIER